MEVGLIGPDGQGGGVELFVAVGVLVGVGQVLYQDHAPDLTIIIIFIDWEGKSYRSRAINISLSPLLSVISDHFPISDLL